MEELEKTIHNMLELLAISRVDKHSQKMQTMCIPFYAKEDEEQACRGEEEKYLLEDQDGQTKEDLPAGKSTNVLLNHECDTKDQPRNADSPFLLLFVLDH